MLVLDQLTGEKKPKEELYKVTTEWVDRNGKLKKTNKYYTSEDAYNKWKMNQEYRQKCIDMMYEYLGYLSFQKIPGVFFHKLSEWEGYGYDVICRCMQNCYKSVTYSLQNKQFANESGKVLYICAIFQNSMNDALNEIKRENKYLSAKKEIAEVVELDIQHKKQKTKDISKFLEEDD